MSTLQANTSIIQDISSSLYRRHAATIANRNSPRGDPLRPDPVTHCRNNSDTRTPYVLRGRELSLPPPDVRPEYDREDHYHDEEASDLTRNEGEQINLMHLCSPLRPMALHGTELIRPLIVVDSEVDRALGIGAEVACNVVYNVIRHIEIDLPILIDVLHRWNLISPAHVFAETSVCELG